METETCGHSSTGLPRELWEAPARAAMVVCVVRGNDRPGTTGPTLTG